MAANAAGRSLISNTVSFKLLPPFHLYLASPQHNTISSAVSPQLVFSTSNPALFNAARTYGLYFKLEIYDKACRQILSRDFVLFSDSLSCAHYADWTPADYVTRSGGIVTIDLNAADIILERGKSYEWNIRDAGDNNNGATFCCFYKDDNARGCVVSRSTNYLCGGDAANGAFNLTIAHDAN